MMARVLLTFLMSSLLLPMDASASEPMSVRESRTSYVSDGKEIKVEVFMPGGQARYPAVLMLYGSGGSLVGKGELETFSKQLAAEGMAVFLVHYFNRTGTLVANDRLIHRWSQVWTDTVRDAVDFVAAHPHVQPDSIGMFGYSLGGYLAVAESSRNRQVGAVVEVAGGMFDELRGNLKRMPPILILHGRQDKRVPVERAYELEQAVRRLGMKPVFHIYENEGHSLSRQAKADAAERALRFFNHHLRS